MANLDIVEYVQSSLAKNIPPQEIRERLLQVGWKEKDIASAFSAIGISGAEVSVSANSEVLGELRAIKNVLEEQNQRIAKLEGKKVESPIFKEPSPINLNLQSPSRSEIEKYQSLAPSFGAGSLNKEKTESVETKVTGKWFAVIGILAILFGVGFFLKYAFENNLIGETGRVILGTFGGLLLLVIGDLLFRKEKYRQYSFFLTGGGLALLYLSIYGAFNFYHLINQTLASVFMILITLGGMIISIKQNSEKVSALALLGGFLTPFLLSEGVDSQVSLFTYILILNLGFLFLSYFKKWRLVYALNFIATFVIFFSWLNEYYAESKLPLTLAFLSLFFLIFLLAPFLRSLFHQEKSKEEDLVISTANAAIYFATSYFLLIDKYEPFLGFFFALGAVVYLICASSISSLNKEDKFGVYVLGGIGLVLLTAAVPIQLSGSWITIAWAAEALILAWFGVSFKSYNLRVFSSLIFIFITIRLIFFDLGERPSLQNFQVIANQRFLTYLVSILAIFITTYLYNKHKAELNESERMVPGVLGVAGNLFLALILSVESFAFFDKKIFLLKASSASPDLLSLGLSPEELSQKTQSLRNFQNLTLSLIWAVYSAFLMIFGILKHIRYARLLAIFGFAAVIFKVFLYDISALSDVYRILSFIILGVILLVVSFLFYRYKEKIKEFLLKE